MIYDLVSYNGEAELLDLRLNILDDVVDQFIVVEFRETFSGKPKALTFPNQLRKFTRFFKKLTYFSIPESIYLQYVPLAEESPNVPQGGPKHWTREFCQKESLKWTIALAPDDATIFVGDVDEIVDPAHYTENFEGITKFKLRVYTYYLNNRSSEQFWGPIRAKHRDIKDTCLNHARNSSPEKNTSYDAGWHFTSLVPYLAAGKLTDSYTKDSYANDWVLSNLKRNIRENKDFLGRDFSFTTDESEWPQYLTEHRNKYKDLCR